MQMSHKNEKQNEKNFFFLVPKKSFTKFSEIMAELWKRFINFNSDLWNERNEEEDEEEEQQQIEKWRKNRLLLRFRLNA